MIIVTVRYHTKPDKRDAVMALAKDCIAATRKEDGNKVYEYLASFEDPNEVFVFEVWETEAALKSHGQSPHFKAFMEARTPYIEQDSYQIQSYEATTLARP